MYDQKFSFKSKMARKRMRRCIKKMENTEDGEIYYMCQDCKHSMLSYKTAKLHRKCTKKLLDTFEPDELIYRCSTCGRYFDNKEQWGRHNDMHKEIGDYDPTKYTYRIDENDFVRSLRH